MFVQIQDLTRHDWTFVRTFVNQLDEAYPPPASAFITLDYQDNIPKRIEFAFEDITQNHNDAYLLFDIWRLQSGRIHRVSRVSIPKAEGLYALTQIVEVNGGTIWVTHKDGDPNGADTISGTVYCRIVEQ
jgi:hypothetical protein